MTRHERETTPFLAADPAVVSEKEQGGRPEAGRGKAKATEEKSKTGKKASLEKEKASNPLYEKALGLLE